MEGQCGKHAEHSQHSGNGAGAVTGDQCQATTDFNDDRQRQRQLRKGKTHRADVADHHGRSGQFRKTGEDEDCAEQYAADQRGRGLGDVATALFSGGGMSDVCGSRHEAFPSMGVRFDMNRPGEEMLLSASSSE
ncbi:hypothetical protein D3C80_418040 [compost metagenome]